MGRREDKIMKRRSQSPDFHDAGAGGPMGAAEGVITVGMCPAGQTGADT